MRKRTKARETALKILYAADVTGDAVTEQKECFWRDHDEEDPPVREFADFLLDGIDEKLPELDGIISTYAENWEIKRMATIDRNVLRIATFELLYAEEVPPKVAINEAIDMAKKYGDRDSGKFVNGILDRIKKEERTKVEGTAETDG